MKYLISVLTIFLILGCQESNNPNQVHSKYKTIMIKSSGEIETLPNQATFNISLNCIDRNIKTSKSCIIEKSNNLTNQLQEMGIDKDDILTTSVNLSKSYRWLNNSKVFEGYKSSVSVFVTVKNIDRLDEIYSSLFGIKDLDLNGLNYSHSKIDSLKNEAYIKALKKSENLCDKLLLNLPESKKEILKIGNVKISSSIKPNGLMLQDANIQMEIEDHSIAVSESSISINRGTIKINATLFVEYQIN